MALNKETTNNPGTLSLFLLFLLLFLLPSLFAQNGDEDAVTRYLHQQGWRYQR